jgi:hypothetical protein
VDAGLDEPEAVVARAAAYVQHGVPALGLEQGDEGFQ